MIQGRFGNNGELLFEIDLINTDNLVLPVNALLDTGFTGWLAINSQNLQGLNWPFVGKRAMQTAKGEAVFNIHKGKITLAEQEYEIPVSVGQEIQEILLGLQWLKLHRLVSDFSSNRLTLG